MRRGLLLRCAAVDKPNFLDEEPKPDAPKKQEKQKFERVSDGTSDLIGRLKDVAGIDAALRKEFHFQAARRRGWYMNHEAAAEATASLRDALSLRDLIRTLKRSSDPAVVEAIASRNDLSIANVIMSSVHGVEVSHDSFVRLRANYTQVRYSKDFVRAVSHLPDEGLPIHEFKDKYLPRLSADRFCDALILFDHLVRVERDRTGQIERKKIEEKKKAAEEANSDSSAAGDGFGGNDDLLAEARAAGDAEAGGEGAKPAEEEIDESKLPPDFVTYVVPAYPPRDQNSGNQTLGNNEFLRALRRVIFSAPDEGLDAEELESAMGKLLPADKMNPDDHNFESVQDALDCVREWYCITDQRVYCVNWDAIMRAIYKRIPAEGVLLHTFVRYLKAESMTLVKSDIVQQTPIPDLLRQRYSNLFRVRTASDRVTTIISRKTAHDYAVGLDPELLVLLKHVHHFGGSGGAATTAPDQNNSNNGVGDRTFPPLPEDVDNAPRPIQWTDVQRIMPAMTAATPDFYGGNSWIDVFKNMSRVVDTQMRAFGASSVTSERTAIFVDGSTIGEAEVATALGLSNANIPKSSIVKRVVVKKKGDKSHKTQQPAASTEDREQQHQVADQPEEVIAPGWMDNDQLISVHLAKLGESPSANSIQRVVIATSAGAAEDRYEAVLTEAARLFPTTTKMLLVTPTSSREVRPDLSMVQ